MEKIVVKLDPVLTTEKGNRLPPHDKRSERAVLGSLMKKLCFLHFLFAFASLWLVRPAALAEARAGEREKQPPNLIYILADDLGYGDLGCYGQTALKTPHLDQMAAEGVRFTRHYAGSTVCAPSRCVLMTGLHSGHACIRGNGPGLLTAKDFTVAALLRQAGYKTGCFGKWGVGNPPPLDDPNRHGFDEFYGYVSMFHAHNFYPEFLVKNGREVPLRNRLYPEWKAKETSARKGGGVAEIAVDYAPQLIFEQALAFVRENRNRPFFLFYAPNIPHANNEGGREPRIGRNGMRVPNLGAFEKQNWPLPEKGFARMIQMIDDQVGELLALLKDLNIDEQTAVFFSSDNGPHQEGGHRMLFFDSNGPLKGMKRDLYEGGLRVPLIARWPKQFPAGIDSDLISGFQDMLPTFAALAEAPATRFTDGVSLAPTLLGNPASQIVHPHLYWEFYERGGKTAVLQGNWKAIRRNFLRNPQAPVELYNLTSDPGETNNVAAQHPALVRILSRIMTQEHSAP